MTAETTAATATADPSAGTATTDATATSAAPPAAPQAADTSTETKPDAAADDTSANADAPADEQAQEPIAYEFKAPEGMDLDADLITAITPILQKHKVPQELVSELTEAYAQRLQQIEEGAGAALEEAFTARIKAQSEEWLQQTMAAKDIGEGVRSRVMSAVGAVATPEIKEELNRHGWGNHPGLIRLIDRLIDYVPPETGERGGGAGGAKTIADALFGDLPSARG
jgi:hypothetical protein